MIAIIAERHPANKQGDDITDPLITTHEQAAQRGRLEIDKNSTDRFTVSGTMPLYTHMQPGGLVEVIDLQKGKYMSILETFSCTLTRNDSGNFTAVSNVKLERES